MKKLAFIGTVLGLLLGLGLWQQKHMAAAKAAPASTTFFVTNTSDSGLGSLRQAILDANSNPGADIIDATGVTGTITVNPANYFLVITDDVSINGPGQANLSISGGNASRIFWVQNGTITIQNLTLANGFAKGGNGGGGGLGAGGAIFMHEGKQDPNSAIGVLSGSINLTLINVTLKDNVALGGNGGGGTVTGGGGMGGNGNAGGASGGVLGSAVGFQYGGCVTDATSSARGANGGIPIFGSGGREGSPDDAGFGGGGGGNEDGGFAGGGGGAVDGGGAFGRGGFGGGGGNAGSDNNFTNNGGARGGFGGGGGGLAFPGNGSNGNAGNDNGQGGFGAGSGTTIGGGGMGAGGAIFVASGVLTMRNVNLENNSATGGTGGNSGQGLGGALFIFNKLDNGGATAPGTTNDPQVSGCNVTYSNNTASTSNNNAYGNVGAATGCGPACPSLLTVNHLGDAEDAVPGDGVCATSGGVCTLRAAIMEANAIPPCSPLTINFSVTGVINLATKLPFLDHPNLIINGPGASQLTVRRSTVVGTPDFNIFTITGTSVRLAGLTISNGKLPNNNYGGGLETTSGTTVTLDSCVISGNSTVYFGGGIASIGGMLILNNCLISGNQAGNAGGVWMFGGSLTMSNTTISGNTTGGQDGGILFQTGATGTLTNSTISGNTAGSFPGAIRLLGSGTVSLTNCTVADNQSDGRVGGIEVVGSTSALRLQNTIVANNDGPNFVNHSGTVTSLGNNLTSDNGGGFLTGPGDQINTNPLLAPLANYGGSTQTHALLPGSPAINAGNNCVLTNSCASNNLGFNLTTDQRGIALPQQSTVDIGAFESRGFTLAIAGGNNQSTFVGSPFAQPLLVGVTHIGAGEPVNGGLVSFAPPGSGASATILTNPATISNGQASVNATANNVMGTYAVSAAANGGNSVSFTLTNTCQAFTISPSPLPTGVVGTPYNQTLTASPAGSAPFSFAVTTGALPPGLSLTSAGVLNGTPTTTGTFNFTLTVTGNGGGCSTGVRMSLTIACPTVTLSPTTLPAAAAGIAYSQSLSVSPVGAYTFSLVQGNLPSGLTIHPQTGVISGMPSTVGSVSFFIKAQATNGCSGTQSFTLQINCPVVTLNPASLPNGLTTAAYSQTLSATPAGGNYSFGVTGGNLPPGLNLNLATGSLTGRPTANGTYNFTITATGFGGCVGSKAYSITVGGGGCPTITLVDLPNGTPGQLYSNSVTASPSGTYSYAVTAGSLPAGLTLYGSFGLIYGYPMAAGTFNFTITASSLGDANNCTGSKSYSLTIGGAATQSLVFGDFDGDGRADLSVWRGQTGDWLTVASGDGELKTEAWGSPAAPYYDVMTPGDYDGDGKMDLAVFRRSTVEWLIKGSKDGAITSKVWGLGTDIPVAGDYDGDGKTDLAVWRGAETNWYILRSSDQQTETISWGTSRAPYRDVPVAADFDGDGKTDVAVFRQANGHWYIKLSSDGSTLDKAWGLGSDVPVAADYDGDGRCDIAVWRGTETNWYVLRSSDGVTQSISWGTASLGDVPAPGDYDGDGKADAAIWRETDGTWYIRSSGNGETLARRHGQAGDLPVTPSARP